MGSCDSRCGCDSSSAADEDALCESKSPSVALPLSPSVACCSSASACRCAVASAASAPMPAARSTALRLRRVHRSACGSVDAENGRAVCAQSNPQCQMYSQTSNARHVKQVFTLQSISFGSGLTGLHLPLWRGQADAAPAGGGAAAGRAPVLEEVQSPHHHCLRIMKHIDHLLCGTPSRPAPTLAAW